MRLDTLSWSIHRETYYLLVTDKLGLIFEFREISRVPVPSSHFQATTSSKTQQSGVVGLPNTTALISVRETNDYYPEMS
jgi:hypothetical protein